MENRYYLDTDKFDMESLKEMANDLADSSIEEFETIKNRPWYKKLISALSIGNGDKKVALRQIRDHSELMKIFVSIYDQEESLLSIEVKKVVSGIIKCNSQLKLLYDLSVLNLSEGYKMPQDMNSRDQLILMSILGEYNRDNHVDDKETLLKYMNGVFSTIDSNIPTAELNESQLDKIEMPEVVYRCLTEQKIISSDDSFPDYIQTYIGALNISDVKKNAIENQVKQEYEKYGKDIIIGKYQKNSVAVELETHEIDAEEDESKNKDPNIADYDGIYYIRNAKNDERFLQGGFKTGHVRVCNENNNDNQKWEIKKHRDNGYIIENVSTKKCLSVLAAIWGVIPLMEKAWNKKTSQLWYIVNNDDGTVTIRTKLNTSIKTGSAIGVVDGLDGATVGTDHWGRDVFKGARWLLEKVDE